MWDACGECARLSRRVAGPVQTPAQRAPHPRPQGQPEIDAGSWAQWYADSGGAQPGQCGGFARTA